ncbi:MAG TPA: AsmA-like C-terminal region-containing protein, partial [Chthoniobacterales bacterium]|nr:AsmA-like C-terminal region-containing protein [Chthoniobacterales bacterium]
AHIYFPPEQIYVSQAEGVFGRVLISATGQLIKRADYKPSSEISAEAWQQRLRLLQIVATELNRLTFAGGAPRLQIKFSGDMAKLEDAHVEATLTGEHIVRGGYQMQNLSAAAEWADQTLALTELSWKDGAGEFSAQAGWHRGGSVTFQIQSTIDVKEFLDSFGFGQMLAAMTFTRPPNIELSGSAGFGSGSPALNIVGRAAVESFTYRNVPFLSLAGDFAWDGQRTMLREVRLQHSSGELKAELLDVPEDFRLNVESTISPSVAQPLVSTKLHQFLSEWEWPRPPHVHLAAQGTSRDPQTWTGEGTIAQQRARFRGVWMNSGSASFRFGNGAITYDNLRITRDEGIGTGSFTYDFARHEVRLANVQSTLRPADAIYWIDPKLFKAVVPYKFRQPPSITANGVVRFHGGKGDHLELNVEAPTGMDYAFLGKILPLERVTGRLLFTDDRLQLSDVNATLFSGSVKGNADISLAKGDPHYHASILVDTIDFPRLTDLYFKYDTTHGRLTGTYDFTGLGDNARTMRGDGKVTLRDGDVFAIPIFGPLSGLLGSIFPGSGYSVAREARASFSIRDGVIHTDDFNVSGKIFGMVGHGDLFFLNDKLDFDVRISANGPGILLAPVYKLFEYEGTGSLAKPVWRPKRF